MNKKILISIILIISIIGIMPIQSKAAVPIDSAYIYATRKTDGLLMWKGLYIHTHMAVYNKDGKEYPAYCLNRDLPGVEIGFSQTVDVNNLVSDIMVWRAIINGYPYKSISELGCKTEEEAYLATKQAVYCMLTNRDVSEYSAVGESGERTLNALKQIVTAARGSSETKLSSELKINQESSLWKIDNINNEYISQQFSVSANASIDNYKVNIDNIGIEGVKVTDINNNEKQEFSYGEKFKVLMPITNVTKDGNFTINVFGKIATKPVLYGKSKDSSLQNYALTGYTYEDGNGSKKVYYTKNDTKIVIIKKDKKTEEYLKGVEFDLLDNNKEVIHVGLITDENGKIEINNLMPGKYYIRETRTLDGYQSYEELIEVELELNEVYTVNVLNSEEKPIIETEKIQTENTVETIKTEVVNTIDIEEINTTNKIENINTTIKLPKTGM